MICFQANENSKHWVRIIEDFAQSRFSEISEVNVNNINVRAKKKLRSLLRDLKLKQLMNKYSDELVDAVVAMDKNDDAYLEAISEPWLNGNIVPSETFNNKFWINIFQTILIERNNADFR